MSKFWAICAYYNPLGYTSRYRNFTLFRRQLNVPLLIVELSGSRDFELTPNDGDLLIQLRGEPWIWQKERLLNIALSHLPASAEYVAWLDCDILFENSDWVSETTSKLDQGFDLVQPFRAIIHQKPQHAGALPIAKDWCSDPDELSAAFMVQRNAFSFDNLGLRGMMPAHGHAWAAKISFLKSNPVYDKCIVGGGDTFYLAAGLGKLQQVIDKMDVPEALSDAMVSFYSDMPRVKLSFSSNCIFHLYHGDFSKRGYNSRHQILSSLKFNPELDLTEDPRIPLAFTSVGKRILPHLKQYLMSRQEDQGWDDA